MKKLLKLAALGCLMNCSIVQAQTDTLVDPRDGKEYKTVQIGSQVWMGENLAYKIRTFDVYPQYANNKHADNYGEFSIYDNADSNYIKYGLLYDFNVAKKACPVGWHLPSKEEYDTLLLFVGEGDLEKAYKALIAGGNSGFNGLFGGFTFRGFKSKGKIGGFWTSTQYRFNPVSCTAIPLMLFKKENKVSTSTNPKKFVSCPMGQYMSVRCIKD